jgi:outer membrane protein OmpA-like peptidoglycan-associated protein
MAKAKNKKSGEQGYLIDTQPKNKKEILATARAYKQAQAERQAALAKETELKNKLLEQIEASEIIPSEGGKIRFSLDGYQITVTPRDMLVSVQERNEEK